MPSILSWSEQVPYLVVTAAAQLPALLMPCGLPVLHLLMHNHV